jgi:hypothetical protein
LASQFRKTSLAEGKGLEFFIASCAEMQEFGITGPDTASPWLAAAGEEHRVGFVRGFELVRSHVVLQGDLPKMRNRVVSVSPR